MKYVIKLDMRKIKPAGPKLGRLITCQGKKNFSFSVK